MELEDVDKIIFYSQICKENEIIKNLDLDDDVLTIRKMRNNFGRFWNELSIKQRDKWIKLSTNKEINRKDMDKIIRYTDEVDVHKFLKKYDEGNTTTTEDNKNKIFNFKYNILLFWVGQTTERKNMLMKIINKYWKNNEYEEYVGYGMTTVLNIYKKSKKSLKNEICIAESIAK